MHADRWRLIEQLFEEAAALDTGERDAFLARACGTDKDLRSEVESLLAADGMADRFLSTPAVAPEPANRPASFTQRRIGHYRVEARIGEGGMSTVYLAVRADDVYQQKV